MRINRWLKWLAHLWCRDEIRAPVFKRLVLRVSVSWDAERLDVVLLFFLVWRAGGQHWRRSQPSSDTARLPERRRPTATLRHGAAARERRAEVEKDGMEVPSAGA